MSKEIITIIIAASPFVERGALPAAVIAWNFPIIKAFILSIFGNFLPVIPLLLFWNFLAEKLSDRFYYFNRLFARLSERTRKKHARKFEKLKDLALFAFVAIPLPLIGVWSGTLAAFVFGIPAKRASLIIGMGIITYGIIVSILLKTGSEIISII